MIGQEWNLRKLIAFGLVATLGSGLLSLPAMAADLGTSEPAPVEDPTHPFFRHRMMLQAGAAFNQLSSSVQVGRAGTSAGTEISLEDDLRFASAKTSLDTSVRLRLGDSWNVEFSYFDASRSKSAGIQKSLEFGRLEFPASASVDADFGISAYRLALGYAFHRSQATEVGVNFGLHI